MHLVKIEKYENASASKKLLMSKCSANKLSWGCEVPSPQYATVSEVELADDRRELLPKDLDIFSYNFKVCFKSDK